MQILIQLISIIPENKFEVGLSWHENTVLGFAGITDVLMMWMIDR